MGAIAGAWLGHSVGGLLGSLIGGVLGDYLERKVRGASAGAGVRHALGGTNELVTLAALAAMLAKIAKADGVVTADEVRYCELVFARCGIRGERRDYCVRVFQRAKNDGHSIYEYAADFAANQRNPEILGVVYAILWDLACIDGYLHSTEHEMLRNLPRYLGLGVYAYATQARLHGIGAASGGTYGGGTGAETPREPDPYEVLGVSGTASDDEVKKAYRELAKRLHPDVLRAQGLTDEMLAKATERMARVNAAWEAVKRARGL